jgi:S-(hydroxymethyl)glutathione dehydrogenase/alcohol dehydrogenase
MDFTVMEKQLVGAMYGSANMRYDIPKLLSLYESGQLDLEGMVTSKYKLGDINQGYQDMRNGTNVRGILTFV